MTESKIEAQNITGNTLINAYYKFGELKSTLKFKNKLLEAGLKRDPFTYKALIHGFYKTNELERENELMFSMVDAGFTPSYCTFSWIGDGYNKKDNMDAMIEIYNEQVRHLLVSHGSNKRYPLSNLYMLVLYSTTKLNFSLTIYTLDIRNTFQLKDSNVTDALLVPVTCSQDVLDLMRIGQKNRVVGATGLNERSTRCHSVLTVHVRGRELVSNSIVKARSLLSQSKFDRCFTRPSIFLIQTYIFVLISFSAFPNSSQRLTKSFQTPCFSMATSPKETSASGSPSVPSSPHQEQPEFNIQPIQIIPGQASAPEKLAPRRQQGVKIAENPSLATSPREVDTEMDKKIRSIVSSILKDASVPDAEKDVPTSSTPNVSVPDAEKDVPTSSTPNAEVLPSPSEEESTEEDDQATEETPAPKAPEPAPGDLIDLEEVESDEEPIANRLAPGIAERLQNRKGKTPIKRSGRIKTMAQKKSTPITPTTSRRSKVAIPSKKRKEISSSDSDDDVELDVSTSKRAKTSGKKVPGNVPDAPLDNISFHSIGNAERWKFVYQRRLALERELGRDALDCKEIMDLIKAAGLLKTVTKLGDCYESLVREFIVNIPSDIKNRKSNEYQRVFVRGKCVRFSPAVINKYLGRPTDGVVDITVSEHQIAKEITAKQVQHWPKKGKLSAGKLSVKYAILHRIGAANWVPTNHTSTVATGLGKFLYAVGTKSKFNFGNYVFDQTVKHSESFAVKLPIAFPTVLCGIMLSQHPNILNYTDSVMKRESPLSLHYKLFEGTHVPDIVSTSGKAAASGAVSKDALIAELKDTCKVLEATIKATTEKKMELERLIKRLSESGIAVFAFPFGTHFMALLNLVLKLVQATPNCSFSFICTQKSNATHFNRPHIPNNIKAYSISDGIPMSHAQLANHPIEKVNLFLKTGPQNLQKDMPQDLLIVGERETVFSRTLVSLAKVRPQAMAVVMNFFEELDPPLFVQDMRSKLHSKSVAYVCFGTVVALPPHELVTVAEALEESGFPFLWSLMEGLMDLLPNGFLERTKM
ncbi:Kinesin-like protein KIN-14F [Glycine soja]